MKLMRPIGAIAISVALLAGCTMTDKPEVQNYSGWMKDYSNLSEARTPTGGTSMRWLNPTFKNGQYKAIIIEDIGFYPQPQPGTQVSVGTLKEIPVYLKQQLVAQLGNELKVVQKPGPGVLRLRSAITGVDTPIKNLQVYEYIPIALIFSGISTATGARDHETVVYLEAQITDSQSGEMMAKAVRKGIGETVENNKAQVKIADLKPVLNDWAKDAAVTLKAMK